MYQIQADPDRPPIRREFFLSPILENPNDVNNGKGPRTLADPQCASQKRNQLPRFVQNPFIVHVIIESRVSQLAEFLSIDVKWLKSRVLHKFEHVKVWLLCV